MVDCECGGYRTKGLSGEVAIADSPSGSVCLLELPVNSTAMNAAIQGVAVTAQSRVCNQSNNTEQYSSGGLKKLGGDEPNEALAGGCRKP